MQTAERKRQGWKALAGVLAVLLAIAACLLWRFTRHKPPQPGSSGLEYEQNVVEGDLGGREERRAELAEQVEEGMVTISINATPCTASDGSGLVNWSIENPAEQGKLIRVEILRGDTREVIYQTGAIKPGNYLAAAPLDVSLAPGVYDCTALFYTYELDTETYIGAAGAGITLTVS